MEPNLRLLLEPVKNHRKLISFHLYNFNNILPDHQFAHNDYKEEYLVQN